MYKVTIGNLVNQLKTRFAIQIYVWSANKQIRGGNFKLIDHVTSLIHCKDSSWLDVRTAETTHQSIKYLPHQAQLLP